MKRCMREYVNSLYQAGEERSDGGGFGPLKKGLQHLHDGDAGGCVGAEGHLGGVVGEVG